jgi:hypothetical protein
MWEFIFECHRKQFHTILETKFHILIPKNGPEKCSSKVTLELEMELLNSVFKSSTSRRLVVQSVQRFRLESPTRLSGQVGRLAGDLSFPVD